MRIQKWGVAGALPGRRGNDVARGTWSADTQDRWFYGLLALGFLAVGWIALPFLDALLFASATVVVTWPLYVRVAARLGGRSYAAAVVTGLGIVVLVLVPVTLLAWWFVQEATEAVRGLLALNAEGVLQSRIEEWVRTADFPGRAWLTERLPEGTDPIAVVLRPIQQLVTGVGELVATSLPSLLGSVVGAVIDLVVYAFAVITLYVEGPALLRTAMRISPLRDVYERRLFEVFREFATNMLLGSIATATVQGLIAGVGYAIAGVQSLVLVTLLTAMSAFVPVIGTAVVWLPTAIYVGATEGWGWGVFIAVWNAGLTGTIDNVLRPLFIRGRSHIHPLAILLAVLGGLAWLGLVGALVGPVLVAALAAMLTIWREDFADPDDEPELPDLSGDAPEATPIVTPEERLDAAEDAMERPTDPNGD
jgi:predicted PurR-regulated permease PerM